MNSKTKDDIIHFFTTYSGMLTKHVRKRYSSPGFTPILNLIFKRNHSISLGGTNDDGDPEMDLVAWQFEDKEPFYSEEYRSIAEDPVIGSLGEIPWDRAAACLISHEMAHVICYCHSVRYCARVQFGMDHLPESDVSLFNHGFLWQRVYADLRRNFVNDFDLTTVSSDVILPVNVFQPKSARA